MYLKCMQSEQATTWSGLSRQAGRPSAVPASSYLRCQVIRPCWHDGITDDRVPECRNNNVCRREDKFQLDSGIRLVSTEGCQIGRCEQACMARSLKSAVLG